MLEVCRKLRRRFIPNCSDLPGRPDIVFPRGKTAVFIHGCFWHSHDCPKGKKVPVQNAEFWRIKRAKTVERDRRQREKLEELGYTVFEIWECETNSAESIERKLRSITKPKK